MKIALTLALSRQAGEGISDNSTPLSSLSLWERDRVRAALLKADC
jgi:hypothetical protein